MKVSSFTNPTVKQAIKLREHRERRDSGLFLIEGAREVGAAIDAGVEIETLFHVVAAPDAPGARNLEVTQEVFAKIGYRDDPEGVLAIARAFSTSLADPPTGPLTILVADHIEKPGNLGAMLRTADAVGAWVIVADPVTDVFNPNVVRASIGALFSTRVMVAVADDVRAWLIAHDIRTVVTSPAGSVELFSWGAPERCAVVIGAEDTGVDERWMTAADQIVSIPMKGAADSLNASTSAAVMLYEISRQSAGR